MEAAELADCQPHLNFHLLDSIRTIEQFSDSKPRLSRQTEATIDLRQRRDTWWLN